MKKMLVTLGPSSLFADTIRQLAQFNPYVFRLNMSHVPLDELEKDINLITSLSKVPVCIDSEGAQIRTHVMQNGSVELVAGQEVELLSSLEEGTAQRFSLTPENIVDHLQVGNTVRLDWHGAKLKVVRSGNGKAIARVEVGGNVASRKAVDIDAPMPLQAITLKDKEAIRIGRGMGVKHFALSFANTPGDVQDFRKLTGEDSVIISKIESLSALQKLRAILEATDEALIDRGDLSRAVPLEKIPFLQMRIISIANILDTPIFVATNLLESMILAKDPTRAELNDVVSSTLMGASGLVLAAETAAGSNPVRSAKIIRTMLDLCKKWTPNASIEDILSMSL